MDFSLACHQFPPFLKKRIIALDPFNDMVDGNDDEEAKNRLIQGRRGSHPQVGTGHKGTEHVDIDHVRGVEELTVVSYNLVEHLEIPPEDPPYLQKEHDDNGGLDGREGDIPNLMKNIGPVDIRRLKTLRIYGGNGGYVDY